MLFASSCPWVRVPIWQNWPEVHLPPYSNSPRWLAPDGDLLTISILYRSLPTFRSQEHPPFYSINFRTPWNGSYKTITAYSMCSTFWTIFSSLSPRGLNVWQVLAPYSGFSCPSWPMGGLKNPGPFPRTRIYGYCIVQHSYGSSPSRC